MTEKERKARRKIWNKIIARWKKERVDRTAFTIGTLDDERPGKLKPLPMEERMDALMKLRWLNYGPEALYGRLERVLRFGKLPPPRPRRRPKK
jgi:hypothetical protein